MLKSQIQKIALEIGIDKIGFAPARDFFHLSDSLHEQQNQQHHTGFEHPVISERLDPKNLLPGAKTLISICLAYPSEIKNPIPSDRENRRGLFARASWGIDYHTILAEKMQKLINAIQPIAPDATFKAMVDTGELSDVAVAERAGIGFIGRNGLLITKEFGSWVYLGEIVTTLEITPDKRVEFGCGDCYRCVQSCPPQALLGDGRMNGRRCLSYQTQTKDYMPQEFRRQITHVIYGCDICQQTCPYNLGKSFHRHPEMEPDPEIIQPPLKPLLTITNRDFKTTYGKLAGSWRGKKPIQRNAIIALANYRDQTALPQLIQLVEEDPRPMIRGTSAWAIAQIVRYYHPTMIECLENQCAKERDEQTIQEFQHAIAQLKGKRLPRSNQKEV